MIARGIFRPVLPEIDSADRLRSLIAAEVAAGVAPDPIRRLSALLPPVPEAAVAIATRLKLSNKARKRIGLAADGETVVSGVEHVDRGYADLVGQLAGLGVQVTRETAPAADPFGADPFGADQLGAPPTG